MKASVYWCGCLLVLACFFWTTSSAEEEEAGKKLQLSDKQASNATIPMQMGSEWKTVRKSMTALMDSIEILLKNVQEQVQASKQEKKKDSSSSSSSSSDILLLKTVFQFPFLNQTFHEKTIDNVTINTTDHVLPLQPENVTIAV